MGFLVVMQRLDLNQLNATVRWAVAGHRFRRRPFYDFSFQRGENANQIPPSSLNKNRNSDMKSVRITVLVDYFETLKYNMYTLELLDKLEFEEGV